MDIIISKWYRCSEAGYTKTRKLHIATLYDCKILEDIMRNNSGFTLIEVMIVVAIVAILASIAVPSYQSHIVKSKIKEAQTNLVALSLSAENSYQRTLTYPQENLTSSNDVKSKFPAWNPTSAAFNYAYVSTNGKEYTITATGVESRVSGCTLTLKNDGSRNATGCSVATDWN